MDYGAQTGLIARQLLADPHPDVPGDLAHGGHACGFGWEFFQWRTAHMRKPRKRYIPGPLVFTTDPIVEAANFEALVALVEHNILQCEFHRTPD